MASLAGLLKQKGHEVEGSDQEMYEPMAGMLKEQKIKVHSPYSEFHLKQAKPDMVVVGNAISRGNSELEYVLSIGQSYRSLPEILKEEFLEDKCPIVIAGTHGKTTTSALVSWILESAGLDPTVFVGGFIRNIGSSFKLGKGKYVVLEGDEYDTAFFDKGPKFYHYRPYIGIVNNIELDHVDIYKDLEAIKITFGRFMNLIPQTGLLVVSRENIEAYEVAKSKKKSAIASFGIKKGDYTAKNITANKDNMTFDVFSAKGGPASGRHVKHLIVNIKTRLTGEFNVRNILAAVIVADFLKIPHQKIEAAMETFEGVKRRAEIIVEKNGITVIDDYAHHPTAIRETVLALKKKFRMKRIFVMFEPGSASAKRRIFEKQFVDSLTNANLVYMFKPFHVEHMNKKDVINNKSIVAQLNKAGTKASNFENIDKLLFQMKQDIHPNDVIVIMSCRGFDGLRERIADYL